MNEHVTETENRSLIGMLDEMSFLGERFNNPGTDLHAVSMRLADTRCGPLSKSASFAYSEARLRLLGETPGLAHPRTPTQPGAISAVPWRGHKRRTETSLFPGGQPGTVRVSCGPNRKGEYHPSILVSPRSHLTVTTSQSFVEASRCSRQRCSATTGCSATSDSRWNSANNLCVPRPQSWVESSRSSTLNRDAARACEPPEHSGSPPSDQLDVIVGSGAPTATVIRR